MASLAWAVVLFAGLTCTNALGIQASLENHPSTVQIEYRIYTSWSQQCSGSIITNYHIATAASCFQDVYSNRRCRSGASQRGSGGVVSEILNSFNHPSYGSNGDDGDITVFRLVTSLVFGPTVARVSIVPQDYFIPENQVVKAVGWGSTMEGGILSNDNLYSLDLNVKSINECFRQYQDYSNPRNITVNMICLGLSSYGGRDLDARDSGAPIFYYNVLVGHISFGVSRGQDAMPIVATRMSSYTNWVIATAV